MKTGYPQVSPQTTDDGEYDDCVSPEQRRRDKRHGRGREKQYWQSVDAGWRGSDEEHEARGRKRGTHRQQICQVPRELRLMAVMTASAAE